MTPSQRAIEAAARAAAKVQGDDFDQIPRDKPHWTEQRGQFGGRFRDINEPFQGCYLQMAEEALAAALAVDGAEPQGWQPIESAPKDGRDVLCYVSGIGMGQMVLYWTDGYWREKANGMGLKTDPVAWRPLPLPPAANDGEERR